MSPSPGREVLDRPRAALGEAVADEVQPDLGVLLGERDERPRLDAARVEEAGPRVLAPQQPVGQDHRRGGAAGHAPLGEAGRHQHLLVARRERADVGHAVDRGAVLRGPAVLDRLHVPVLAGEALERAVALLGVAALAGLVALAADQQQLLAVERDGADRARGRVAADEHALRRRAGDPAQERVGALLGHAREGERAVEEGVVRRDHDVVGGHVAAGRLDGAALIGVDLDGVGVLVDRVERLGEGQQVLADVELGLVVEAHGGRDGVGQRRLVDERRGQPGRERGLGLALGVGAVGVRAEVGVGGAAAEVAVDAVALDALGHPRERRLVGGAVGPRARGAELRPQPVVDHPVLGGDLGGRVAAHAAGEPAGLEQHDAQPGLLEQQRGGDPDDAAADHRDVGVHVRLEPRPGVRLRPRVDPDRRVSHARRSASSSRRISDSALRPFVTRCSGGSSASGANTPSGFSVIVTSVPPSLGSSSSVTVAVPAGRPFARRRKRCGRLGLERDGVVGRA